MGKIALIFDTESGNTNRVAMQIARRFPDAQVDVFSAAELDAALLERYSSLIVGTPSMSRGKLADNWQFFIESDGFDFSGKTVALFALGDQQGYPEAFADGLGTLYDRLTQLGATFVGRWPTKGYDYRRSRGEVDGSFVGLVIDQDNQPELTHERIAAWVAQIAEPLLAAAAAGEATLLPR